MKSWSLYRRWITSCCHGRSTQGRLSSHALNAKSRLTQRLELHLVWPVRGAKAEARGEVVNEVSLLLNVGQKSLVDGLLVLNAVLGGLLLLSRLLVLFI